MVIRTTRAPARSREEVPKEAQVRPEGSGVKWRFSVVVSGCYRRAVLEKETDARLVDGFRICYPTWRTHRDALEGCPPLFVSGIRVGSYIMNKYRY